jgi:hypothetical protein
MHCNRCDAWIHEDDRYCSICGARLSGAELTLLADGRPVGEAGSRCWRVDQRPGTLGLEVRNVGNRPLRCESGILCSLPGVWEEDSARRLAEPLDLDPGESHGIELEVSEDWVDHLQQRVLVRLQLAYSELQAGDSPSFELYPVPELQDDIADAFVVLLDGKNDEEFWVRVRPRRGAVQIVGRPDVVEGSNWLTLEEPQGDRLLNVIDADSEYRFRLKVDEAYLMNHERDRQKLAATIELPYKDEQGRVQRWSITPSFRVQRPPTIQLGYLDRETNRLQRVSNMYLEGVAGVNDMLKLQIDNCGDDELQVFSITSSSLRVVPKMKAGERLKVAKRSQRVVELELHLREVACTAERNEQIDITVVSNDPQAPSGSVFHIDLTIKPIKTDDVYLIMDFGTSASVVGLADESGGLGIEGSKLIAHPEKSGSDHYVPTVIYYRTPDDFKIGDIAIKQGQASTPDAVQLSFKRDICRVAARQVICGVSGGAIQRSPEQITRDYLIEFFVGIQQAIRARFSEALITHPVKFSLQQVEMLRSIVQDCLGLPRDKIELWTEPAAGSMEYIFRRLHARGDEEDDCYHLLVYDFGGGTTDISLMHIDSARYQGRGKYGRLKPTLLGLTGDLDLGGDDMTRELVQEFERRVQEVVKAELDAKHGDGWRVPLKCEDARSVGEYQVAVFNQAMIHSLAEGYKIFRSEVDARLGNNWRCGPEEAEPVLQACRGATRAWYGTLPPVIQRNEQGMDLIEIRSPIRYLPEGNPTWQDIFLKGRVALPVDKAYRLAEERIRACIDRAHKLWERYRRPETSHLVILPIGRSSALPLVRELFEARFGPPRPELEYSWYSGASFKECIVRGLQHLVLRRDKMEFDESGLEVVTRSLGWPDLVDDIFVDVISIGTPLAAFKDDRFIWGRYQLTRRFIVKIFEKSESNIGDSQRNSLNPVRSYRATDHFSREELAGGLEVGLAVDKASRLQVRLRAGGKTVDPDASPAP